MNTYIYTERNSPLPHQSITLPDKPTTGDLIIPNPTDKHHIYLEVKHVIHRHRDNCLLIVEPFDWAAYHKK